MDSNNLLYNIKYLLSIRNLKQSDFGNMLGVSQKIVSNWVTGVSQIPLDKIILLSKEFDIDLDDLILGDLSKSPKLHSHLINSEAGQPIEAYTRWHLENNPHLLKEQPERYQKFLSEYEPIKSALLDVLGDRLAKIDEIYDVLFKADILEKASAKQHELNMKKSRSKKKGE